MHDWGLRLPEEVKPSYGLIISSQWLDIGEWRDPCAEKVKLAWV